MTTTNNIGIHLINLEKKECAIFNRVIAFNISHGLKAHITESIEDSDLIIFNQTSLPQVKQYVNNKTLIVLSDDEACTTADIQIKRPILITKVINSLTDAIELTNNKITENTSEKTETEVETQHHALVIDDSASIRKQLELELRKAGITSDFADSGEAALEKIKNNHFNLIFLDIIMPGMDGYQTCKAMRATAEYKKTPIIMLSGKTSPLNEVQGVIAGATTYLTKPIKSDKFQETLNRVTKWIENYSKSKKAETV